MIDVVSVDYKCFLSQGCCFGTIVTMPIAGLLSKYGPDGGWASVFYCFGAYTRGQRKYRSLSFQFIYLQNSPLGAGINRQSTGETELVPERLVNFRSNCSVCSISAQNNIEKGKSEQMSVSLFLSGIVDFIRLGMQQQWFIYI